MLFVICSFWPEIGTFWPEIGKLEMKLAILTDRYYWKQYFPFFFSIMQVELALIANEV